MNIIKKVILGLENTSIITLPIERVSLLELDGIDALTTPVSNFKGKSPELKIKFSVKVEDYGYYTGTKEDADFYGEFLFKIDRYNLVDITLVYLDETELEISLPWEDGRYDFENKLETLTRLPDGQVQIEIRKA